jgi:hypothetical protein
MMLATKAQKKKLRDNHASQLQMLEETGGESEDLVPVVKLFDAWGQAFWLLTELDENDIAFGLCDLGHGSPELGYVSLTELGSVVGPFGVKTIERDLYFDGEKPLSEYAAEAREGIRP